MLWAKYFSCISANNTQLSVSTFKLRPLNLAFSPRVQFICIQTLLVVVVILTGRGSPIKFCSRPHIILSQPWLALGSYLRRWSFSSFILASSPLLLGLNADPFIPKQVSKWTLALIWKKFAVVFLHRKRRVGGKNGSVTFFKSCDPNIRMNTWQWHFSTWCSVLCIVSTTSARRHQSVFTSAYQELYSHLLYAVFVVFFRLW